jgi:Transposase DDE domain group 1
LTLIGLSGAELEEAPPSRGESRVASRRALSARRLHRHQLGAAERVVAFYNQRGTAEQWIKEGKGAIKRTRLSCRSFAPNAVRLQLHALAYNLGNFMRTLAMRKAVAQSSLTSLREKLIKIGAKVVSHGRYVTFQLVPADPVTHCAIAGARTR